MHGNTCSMNLSTKDECIAKSTHVCMHMWQLLQPRDGERAGPAPRASQGRGRCVCVCVCVCVCARARVVATNAQTAPSPPMRRRAPRLLKGLTRRHRNRTGRARTAAPLDERGSGRGLMRTARAWSLTTATTPSQVPESNGQEHASPPPPCVVNVGGSSATAGLAI
jgi:hypothetical protein